MTIFPTKWRANEQQGWGLSTNQLIVLIPLYTIFLFSNSYGDNVTQKETKLWVEPLDCIFPIKMRVIKTIQDVQVHPQKLTWNLEMMVSNRNLLFQGSIFRFHVCFGGCIFGCLYTWQFYITTFFGLVQWPFQRLIDSQLEIKRSLWITWYIVYVHVFTHIRLVMIYWWFHLLLPNQIAFVSLPFLASGGKESFPKLPDKFSDETNNLWSNSLPKKRKRSKQMCHIKFFFFFLNPFWGFILYLYSVKIPTACLKQFSNSVFHLADLRGVRWVILEMLIGKFPRILQPALGSGDVTGGLRGQVTAGEVVVLGGTGRDVFSRVIYPGLWRTTPKMVSGTHTIPIFLGILMGVVWEQYGAQGVLVFQAPCESTRCGWKRCYTQFPWNGHDFTMVETYDKKNPENQSKFFGIRFWGMKHKDL